MKSELNRRVLVIDDNRAIHDDFRKILCQRKMNPNGMADLEGALFGLPERPRVCGSLGAHPSMCGDARDEALHILAQLELDTLPGLRVTVPGALP